jgi:PEP-CTERM motif
LEELILRLGIQLLRVFGLVVGLTCVPCVLVRGGDIVLDFSDAPPGTLVVSSPYQSQGFILTSTAAGFVFNSPDTGNGSPQPLGNNPFYAGANGLASFAPATITLSQTTNEPFSLLSIDLARNFDFDPAPTGTLAGGGSLSETFEVTTPAGFPSAFQTFDFTGFTGVIAVSWDQGDPSQGLHQFTNIHLSTSVPEPSTLTLLALGTSLAAAFLQGRRANQRRNAASARS